MTKRQQRRAQKKAQVQTTPKPKKSPIVKKKSPMNDNIKKAQLTKLSGYLKGILKAKYEQEERELMWKLIKKYEDEVWRAFTPYA